MFQKLLFLVSTSASVVILVIFSSPISVLPKKITNSTCFSHFPGIHQHFHATNGKLVYCFCGESFLFEQNYPKEGFRTFYFPRYIGNFGAKTHFFFRNPLYILHLYKHATEYISKRASQQQGGNLVKCRRNSRLSKYLNESTERHPSVPNYTVRRSFHHGNLHYCLSPQLG